MHEIDLMLKLQLQGKVEEARALSDKLESIGEDKILDPAGKNTEDVWLRHCFNRGWFLLNDGDYQKGCQLLENGRFLNVYGSPPLRTDAPLYNPSVHDIKGKSIIVSLEGGFGDEIIHARFATSYKKLGADKVYLAAAPELVSILSRIEGVDGVILRNEVHKVQHDFWVPGFSAGWVAGHTFDDFPSKPYMSPLSESVNNWKTLIKSDKKKIGIRWAGNPKFEHQQYRRFPENFITNIAKYEEVQVYSLQRDHNIIQLPENIVDLQHFLLGWEDTMAAIECMDLIITSCTSVAHLAAAMGKETWVVVPILPYHTWTYGAPESNTSPYYECVKLYRQKEASKWNDTFQALYADFETKFNLQHIEHPSEDRVIKRVNLGCGKLKFNDSSMVNVDKSSIYNPDQIVDLNVLPWPWKDNEFDHIVAKNILEYLDVDFCDLLKEMYRVSHNGAIWEIEFPHWRSDTAISDPTLRKMLHPAMFLLFDMNKNLETTDSKSALGFEHGVDIQLVDQALLYSPFYQQRIKEKDISEEEMIFAINHLNNVVESVKLLIQVHKPGRCDKKELIDVLKKDVIKNEVVIL
jgi:hypothetical protein